jgi:uncharacterized protein GlcG (DUF336 family)
MVRGRTTAPAGMVLGHEITGEIVDIETAQLAKNSQPGQQFFGIHASNHGRVMIFAGGIPLRRGGAVIGAIGVSGGDGNQDQTVATAGAAVFSN